MTRFVCLFVLFISFPALAQLRETEESYYSRHMKSCVHPEPRKNIWDLFDAYREDVTDECCARSVRAMARDHARRIEPGAGCPEGKREKSLDCPTSKHWCGV